MWTLLALKYVQSQINIDVRVSAFVSDLKSHLSSYHLYGEVFYKFGLEKVPDVLKAEGIRPYFSDCCRPDYSRSWDILSSTVGFY